MKYKVLPVQSKQDIPEIYRDNPVGLLLEYHNLARPFDEYEKACLLVGMCMDNRKSINVPPNFAYIMRVAGADLRGSEFNISYAVSIAGIRHIALICHDLCGMSGLDAKKEAFIEGLVNGAGWTRENAERHFDSMAPKREIGDEVDFVLSEAARLKEMYPKIEVAPLCYRLEDNRLYCVLPE